uniref:EH domain-containing protein n=1 Tax=Arcella intermedia TaxID=1963864 RepID=A0A6B2L264_9EUKA
MTHDDIITSVKKMYFEKMLPLEQKFLYDEFFSPPLKRSDFEAKPMVMLLGQYSVGKTSFIQYLLKRNFPGMRIGPEPTTDKFTAVMWGEEERTIPGNALSVDQERPFTTVARFGTGFLTKFEASLVPSDMLKSVSFIDTPGVLSGEKQRIGRDYDFPEVAKWFASSSDTILLLFDAHKLDISDEFRDSIYALKGNDEKIKIVLNKADQVTTQQLVRVYGSLMWSLGKVINTPEVMRVYIGSFWDKPYKNMDNEKLFKAEQQDLLDDLNLLPRNSTIRKVNELVKRARNLRAHMYVLDHVKKLMPTFGREKKQIQVTQSLADEYQELARINKLPVGDFPPTSFYEKVFPLKDFTKFPSTNEKLMALMDEILTRDLPNFMTMISPEKPEEEKEIENNPFGDFDNSWGIPQEFIEKMKVTWNSLSPSGEALTGAQLRNVMMESKAPQEHLKKIWTLSDIQKKAKLDEEEFILAMYLSYEAANGNPPPNVLPDNLVPPSKRSEKDKIFTLGN